MISRIRARLEFARNADGFSLTELIFYAAFSVVIITLAGGMLIGAMNARGQVVELTHASSTGQLISRSVEEGVRNAGGALGTTDPIQALGIKAEPVTIDGQLMRARVAVGALNGSVVWQCQAWFFSPETGGVYFSRNDAAPVEHPHGFTVVDGLAVADHGTANWLLLGDGVALPTGVSAFFGAGADRVVLRFEVKSDSVSLVLIPNTVVKRTLLAGGSGPATCY